MKRKHLFASAVMAAVLAGCSQEELTGLNENSQNYGNRPMVEAPVVTVGGVDSRMTAEEVSADGFANVEWQAGDGFGAAVMDIYHSDKTKWEEKFEIVNYINSNVLFKTEDGKNFYADASMPQGNHLFYAPFNVNNISREPLATQLPLNQVVVATTNGMPSNSAIKAFYEDKTSPVFVAYDIVDDAPKTQLELDMRHLYALPLVTLELGNVQLLNEKGELKNDGATQNPKPVYEDNITITAIKFVQNETHTPNIVTKGYIKNAEVAKLLKKTGNRVAWDAKQYEDAETADLVAPVTATKDVTPYETITVTFEGGINITKANPAQFFMVLPGANYSADQLAVYVSATINGEPYISAVTSEATEAAAIKPFRAARLLPGLPYAADEYNADGTKKTTAGTSMTYTISGGFIPTVDVETSGYVDIKTYTQLETYIEEMAYRGETLKQITKDNAIQMIEANQYDPKKYFVITATEEEPIELDDDFIKTFKNACVVTGKNANIEFLADQKNLVLGDIEWTNDATTYFSFGNTVWASGNVTLKAVPAATVALLSTADVTLDAAMTATTTITNEENGTVNLNSGKAHEIWNDYGTLNVNVSTAATIYNGMDSGTVGNAVMIVADNVETAGSINNRATGTATINEAVVTMDNDGYVTMNEPAGVLNATGAGQVNNTVGAKVSATTNTVYAEVSTLVLEEVYDQHTGLNKLVVKDVLTSDEFSVDSNLKIKSIDFAENSGIKFDDKAGKHLDLSGVEVVNILANVTWKGRDFETSSVTAKKIVEAENCKLTIQNITVKGAAGNDGNYDGAIIETEDTAIEIGNSYDKYQTVEIKNSTIKAEVAVEAENTVSTIYLENCKISADTVVKLDADNTVYFKDCDITLLGNGYIVDNQSSSTTVQVVIDGTVKVNGKTLTYANRGEFAQYFNNINIANVTF